MSSKRKTIVVSAVSLRKGGTLTILQDCLCYLSALAADGNYRVIALVHKRELADYPHIEYIEMPDVIKGWGRRLWCEYVTMYKLSQKIMPVDLLQIFMGLRAWSLSHIYSVLCIFMAVSS